MDMGAGAETVPMPMEAAEEAEGLMLAESPGIIPFFPSIMALQPDEDFNASQCICSDLQHEDYSPLYAWFNYIVIIIMLPSLSVFGVVTNFLNVYVYSRPRMRNSSNTYLLFLACSDFFVVLTGLFIFWIDSARSYIPQLVQAPYTTVYTLPFGYMAQSCSIYFTVAAAFDCYVCVCWRRMSKQHCTVRRARRIVGAIVLCSVLYNSLRFPQFNLRKCIHDGSGEMVVEICPTSLFFRINTVYNVYLYMFVMTLFPFLILLLLNMFIVCRKSIDANRLRQSKKKSTSSIGSIPTNPLPSASGSIGKGPAQQQNGHFQRRASLPGPHRQNSNQSQQQAQQQQQLQQQQNQQQNQQQKQSHIAAALLGGPMAQFPSLPKAVNPGSDETITMIMVVVLFLCCNTLALIVNLIETFFEPDALLLNLLSDASNFLVIFNSSVNCVIYLIFNNEYREVFLAHFVHFKGRCFPFHLLQHLFDWSWCRLGNGGGGSSGTSKMTTAAANGVEQRATKTTSSLAAKFRQRDSEEAREPLTETASQSPVWLQCPCMSNSPGQSRRPLCHHCPCWQHQNSHNNQNNSKCTAAFEWSAADSAATALLFSRAARLATEEQMSGGECDSGCDENSSTTQQQRPSLRCSSMCPSPSTAVRSCYLAEVKMIMDGGCGEDNLAMPSPPHIYVRPLMRRTPGGGFELKMGSRNGRNSNGSNGGGIGGCYDPTGIGDILIDADSAGGGDFPVTAL